MLIGFLRRNTSKCRYDCESSSTSYEPPAALLAADCDRRRPNSLFNNEEAVGKRPFAVEPLGLTAKACSPRQSLRFTGVIFVRAFRPNRLEAGEGDVAFRAGNAHSVSLLRT